VFQHKRRTNLDPPEETPKSSIPDAQDASALQGPPKPQVDPTPYAETLRKLYEPLLLELLSAQQQTTLQRYKLLKKGSKSSTTADSINDDSLVAVRLTFLPDFTRGLRVIVFSDEFEYIHRSKTQYDKILEKLPLEYNQKTGEKFLELTQSLGFKFTIYKQGTGVVLVAQGGFEINEKICMSHTELAMSTEARAMFRQFIQPSNSV